MFLIVGLGNPGDRYAGTRHNAGFEVIDSLAGRLGGSFRRHCRSIVLEGRRSGRRLVLAKPQTYMNRSGEAVASLLSWYKVPLDHLLLIYDDMDLPLGRLRLRSGGSAGTHNGMRSVLSALGSQDVPRLRVGIGQTDRDAVGHVLGAFKPEERLLMERSTETAADAVELFIDEGLEAAMNIYNVPADRPTGPAPRD